MIKRQRTAFVFLLVITLAVLPFFPSFSTKEAQAQRSASLYLAPSVGTFTVGSTFTVSLHLNTGGSFVNAVEANLSFPPDKLQVVSPTTGKSFVHVWTAQPTFSNIDGTIKFQGGVPAPGINTESGLISTVTFRVRNTGAAAIRILDSSQVLLNDGLGTNILGQTTDGLYYLSLPAPAGPLVTSPTNPDQEKWYASKNIVLRWEVDPNTQGFSYILNDFPVDDPDDISEGLRAGVSYKDLADGSYYFHIKRLREGIWGGITHFKIQVDNTTPASFKTSFSPDNYTSNRRPILEFTTTDTVSGLDHYELKFIPLDATRAKEDAGKTETQFFIEATSPYSQRLELGRYEVVVRAFDRAGNFYQSTDRLTITYPFFEIIREQGLRLGGLYIIPWIYVWIFASILLLVLAYFARKLWEWHRRLEQQIDAAHEHPAVSEKISILKEKQKEYGIRSNSEKLMLLLFIAFVIGIAFWAPPVAAQTNISRGEILPLEPPVITLFPESISNDEIFYIGGRAGAPDGEVIIYVQGIESGSTFNDSVVTDKTGAWFYSLPQFLNSGKYIVWTQFKAGDEISPPSSRLDLSVAPTAIQFGDDRFSYQDLYLVFVLVLLASTVGLLIFIIYHTFHIRLKNRKLLQKIQEAEDSIRRGFLVLQHDIESELALIRKVKLGKQLSLDEKLREEKLLKDFETISNYVEKEIWEIGEAERKLS